MRIKGWLWFAQSLYDGVVTGVRVSTNTVVWGGGGPETIMFADRPRTFYPRDTFTLKDRSTMQYKIVGLLFQKSTLRISKNQNVEYPPPLIKMPK